MKKNLYIIFFFFLFLHLNCEQTIYKKIQPNNMSTLEWEDEEWPTEQFGNYIQRCYDYQYNLQEFKKRRIIFQIFDRVASTEKYMQREHNALHDLMTADDINLLRGSHKEDNYLAKILDRTHTQLGKVAFYGLLAHPLENVILLKERQAFIQTFLNNDLYFEAVDSIFKNISQQENIVLSFWFNDGLLNTAERYYYSIAYLTFLEKCLNKSSLALEISSLFFHQIRFSEAAITLMATIILPLYAVSLLKNYTLPEPIQNSVYRFQGAGGPFFALYNSLATTIYSAAAGSFITAIYAGLSAKKSFEWARDNVNLELLLQKKLIKVAHFFKAIDSLKNLLDNSKNLIGDNSLVNSFHETYNALHQNTEIASFIGMLKSDTFTSHESIFSLRGKILVCYRLMHDLKDKFEPLLHILGQFDAYLSCARLYKEHRDKNVHFSFAEYNTYVENPTLMLKNFWNPLIQSDHIVANTITMGGSESRNVVITGPNAGGKSALLKAIVINLLLAQSVGIVAADEAILSPFHIIATCLNIVDDIASGNSLFKAQVVRAQEMITIVEQTSSEKFCFIALDELFNGTSAKEGKAASFSMAQYLSSFKNCMYIVATHFPLLTHLEQHSENSVTNYKVSVDIQEQGIHYPFKLENGISNQHIALDILKNEGFDNTLIENALTILQNDNDC